MTNLKTLINAYPILTWRDRLHMIIRWRVCPLVAIAKLVPTQGEIIDLGCGHGLFAQLLACTDPQRSVIGVDLDAHKIALAQQLALPNLHFIAGDIATTHIDPAQAVTILDVFYLIPYAIQEQLLAICAGKLAPGGVIVLKEMAERPRWKVWLNWLEETLAVRVLRITASTDSGSFYFRPRGEWQAIFDKLGFSVETIPLDRGYYHPHIVFIARKAAL
ncbi:MAG: class I SAM-dependent methyltransferase [Chloroflexota bacterium]